MFNHIRTLLLNRSGDEPVDPSLPGEEDVPRDFQALDLPTYLLNYRARLFGRTPDRVMLNYRLRQLLPLVHQTWLAPYALEHDPRITYRLEQDNRLFDAAFAPDVRLVLSAGGTPEVYLQGLPGSPDVAGRCAYQFRITLSPPATVQFRADLPAPAVRNYTAPTSGGMAVIALGDTGYSLLVRAADACQFFVTGCLRPTTDLSELLTAALNVGEPDRLQLFGVQPAEPYKSFRDLFLARDAAVALRLGGLILALAWRSNEILEAARG